ncbi:amino acid ABC transporter permease [Pararhizobium sp. LjRoot238]|uniref:amino acid ABC transporter permease n=1 Tax=Pararhizobium sp. LjRoot238 TaxID=3342293 RepID=UPI003ECDD3CD
MKTITLPGPMGPGFFSGLRSWIGPLPLQQTLLLAGVLSLFFFFGSNMVGSMERLGITPGFSFLSQQANFEIGESDIAYASGDTYARALAAGLANTIKVAFFGCCLATMLGVLLGIARMSGNLLISSFVYAYVEILRSTPLLLQLFLWSAIAHSLPSPRNAFSPFDGFFLTNRGVFIPGLRFEGLHLAQWLPGLVIAVAIVILALRRYLRGRAYYLLKFIAFLLFTVLLYFACMWSLGLSVTAEFPAKGGFNIRGGLSMTPEFSALLIGLVVNASASISEIVRSGIQSVKSGQWEAARALGLKSGHIMRLIVLPQALRVITPLMTSSYLDLTKNSSLAVAIGFPDFVSVANTTANTTGQVFEAITIIVAVYLTLNIGVSILMNLYNRRVALKGGQRR